VTIANWRQRLQIFGFIPWSRDAIAKAGQLPKNKYFVVECSKTETFSSIKKYYLRIRMQNKKLSYGHNFNVLRDYYFNVLSG